MSVGGTVTVALAGALSAILWGVVEREPPIGTPSDVLMIAATIAVLVVFSVGVAAICVEIRRLRP